MPFPLPFRVTGLVFIGLFIPACGSVGSKPASAHVQSGDSYLAEKQLSEALIEYRVAVQKDPNLGRARLKLARAYSASGEFANAFPEYLRAADLLPDDLDVQAEAGNALLLARRFEDAKTKARLILQKNPSHLAGLILLGNALAGLQDLDNAVAVVGRVVQQDARRHGSFMNLGVLQLAKGAHAAAEDAFTTAVKLDPKSVTARLALANFHRSTANLKAAEEEFQAAVNLDPRNFQANRATASFYIETNSPVKAEPYLRRIAEARNDAPSWLELADVLMSSGKSTEAIDALKRVPTGKSASQVTIRLATITHATGKKSEGREILAKLLHVTPNDAAALGADARLLLAEGRIDEAQARAQDAVRADPNSPEAHFILGRILSARGDLEPARKAFGQAISLDPGALDARIELSAIHLQRREIDTAIQIAREAADTNPNSIDAQLAVVRALLARPEDRAEAQRHLQKLGNAYPFAPQPKVALGRFHLANGNVTAARVEFERALDMDPNSIETLSQLIAIEMASARSADARRRLADHLERKPNDPALLLLTGKVLLASRAYSKAELVLRRVTEVDPTNIESFTLLGQLYVSQKRLSEAIKEFSAIVARDPRSSGAHTMLGLLLHAQGNPDDAVHHYEKALDANPNAATAANNLAWLYAESGERLDRALMLAQAAKAQIPSNAEVLDTLGWIYAKQNMLVPAIANLEEAVKLSRNQPLHLYHLGVAYAKSGDDAKARVALEQTLKLRPDFERAPEVKQILSTLVY